jgi:catechol 2,3-dioxygenase-like lactoylglutathione lyase family enzyme
MISISHFDHVTIIITDVSKARAFYTGILGLVEVPAPAVFDFVAIWFRVGTGYLHLLQKPTADTVSPRHFCLHVPDVSVVRRHLHTLGVSFEESVKIPGCDRVFVRDPDGNRIELLHWESPYDPVKHGRFSA